MRREIFIITCLCVMGCDGKSERVFERPDTRVDVIMTFDDVFSIRNAKTGERVVVVGVPSIREIKAGEEFVVVTASSRIPVRVRAVESVGVSEKIKARSVGLILDGITRSQVVVGNSLVRRNGSER
jgi:hypothetical protein